jgi:hypothetical protein
MIHRFKIYFGTLDFDVFGSKKPFLKVLDCHNSSGRAITRHGELDHRTGGSARPQLATTSSYSPQRESYSPRRVDSVQFTVCSVQAFLAFSGSVFLRAIFL